MITAWIVFGLVTSAALSAAALALEHLLRARRRPTRWVWIAAITAPLLLAFGGTWTSAPQLSVAAPAGIDVSVQHDASRSPLPRIELARQARSLGEDFNLDRIAAITWACGSSVLALVLVLSSAYVRGRAYEFARIAGEDLAVADAIGPAVFGFLQPRIVVPKWFLALDPATQHIALAHERQHIAAHDSRLLGAALILLVAMPWNLPLWWQFRRLRLAIEVDCDARVLRCGHDAHAYGATLLRIAEHRSRAFLCAPAMNDTAGALEQRIKLLFASQLRRPKSVAAALSTCVIGCTVAAAQVNPPADIAAPAHIAASRSSEVHASRALIAAPVQIAASTSSETLASRALGRELVKAIQANDTETAGALITAGADVNRVVLGDGTPLIVAARTGNIGLVRLLLEHGANPDLACPGDGNPLIIAAARGHPDIVAELIQRGADVNAIVIGDETPLINAARRGHLAIVEHLVKYGADVNLSAPESSMPFAEIRSPFSEARKYRRNDVVAFLEAKGASSL